MMTNKNTVVHAILYMVFIFILSSIPDVIDKVSIPWEMQNLLHMPLYGVLAFLWMRAFFYNNTEYRRALLLTIAICCFYGITDEFHQYFVPGRDASWGDWLFDAVGSVAGAFIYRYKG